MLKHQKARHNEQVVLNTNQAINDNNQVIMDTNQVVNKNSQVIMDNNQVINDNNQVTIDTNQVANDNNQVLNYNTTGELILPDNDASPFILNVSSMEIPAQNGSFQLTAQNRDPFELPIQNGSTIELQAQNVSQSEIPNVGIDLPSGSMDFLQDSNELQYL
ncbi:BEACH domain-containing protein lvsA-like [Diaphorina citri]|uniref:BEACH domain-containing protein lvsA-like n=1 Tax=Diaphorina citri TaxID=121845 RepID=A0A3Q0J977_DIACI|nr:BEACH domain-containing protein lvsA-like [Diaphorina citri]